MSRVTEDINFGLHVRLKAARERANLTQQELADLLGFSPRSVQNWESACGSFPRPSQRRAILAFIAEHEEVAA